MVAVTDVLVMRLVRINMTAVLVVVHMRSHVLRVVLRFMVLRVVNVTAVSVVLFVMLRHFNLLINELCLWFCPSSRSHSHESNRQRRTYGL